MSIQINCELFYLALERDDKRDEPRILAKTNERLLSLNTDMSEEEMKETVLGWMQRPREFFPYAMGDQDLKHYAAEVGSKPSAEELHLLKTDWSILNHIWGWHGAHENFEKITHCGITPSQSWTDPIMRILARGYSITGDNIEKAKSSKETMPLGYLGGKMAKAFALWSVYFEEPGVLPAIKQVCNYRITRETSYTVTMLVMFTRAWIECCLLRAPIPLLDSILGLNGIRQTPEDEPSPDSLFASSDAGSAAEHPRTSYTSYDRFPRQKKSRRDMSFGDTPSQTQPPQSMRSAPRVVSLPSQEGGASALKSASPQPATDLQDGDSDGSFNSEFSLPKVNWEVSEDFGGAFDETTGNV